jgi:hypothetical protein
MSNGKFTFVINGVSSNHVEVIQQVLTEAMTSLQSTVAFEPPFECHYSSIASPSPQNYELPPPTMVMGNPHGGYSYGGGYGFAHGGGGNNYSGNNYNHQPQPYPYSPAHATHPMLPAPMPLYSPSVGGVNGASPNNFHELYIGSAPQQQHQQQQQHQKQIPEDATELLRNHQPGEASQQQQQQQLPPSRNDAVAYPVLSKGATTTPTAESKSAESKLVGNDTAGTFGTASLKNNAPTSAKETSNESSSADAAKIGAVGVSSVWSNIVKASELKALAAATTIESKSTGGGESGAAKATQAAPQVAPQVAAQVTAQVAPQVATPQVVSQMAPTSTVPNLKVTKKCSCCDEPTHASHNCWQYKKVICKYWKNNNSCRFNNPNLIGKAVCRYAHGDDEIKKCKCDQKGYVRQSRFSQQYPVLAPQIRLHTDPAANGSIGSLSTSSP